MTDANENELEQLMSSEEAARILHCSVRETRRMVRRGDLPVVRFPNSRFVRFRPSTLRRFMRENEDQSAA